MDKDLELVTITLPRCISDQILIDYKIFGDGLAERGQVLLEKAKSVGEAPNADADMIQKLAMRNQMMCSVLSSALQIADNKKKQEDELCAKRN